MPTYLQLLENIVTAECAKQTEGLNTVDIHYIDMDNMANIPFSFASWCNANGYDYDQVSAAMRKFKHQHLSTSNEPIAIESARMADQVFPAEQSFYADYSYRELQRECKARGLSAKGNTATLRERLESGVVVAPVVKAKRERKPKAAKRTAFTLNYRQAQRAVSWLKRNMPSSALGKVDLLKNIGWDNVEVNLTNLLTVNGWAANLSVSDIKDLCSAMQLNNEQTTAFLHEAGLLSYA